MNRRTEDGLILPEFRWVANRKNCIKKVALAQA